MLHVGSSRRVMCSLPLVDVDEAIGVLEWELLLWLAQSWVLLRGI